jgi:4-oxalocrotonate tautomerase
MPLVRISVYSSTTPKQREAIAAAVYEAMRETIGIPDGDRFIILDAHNDEGLLVDPQFMGMQRTERYVLVQIFLSRGRATQQKQALYARIAELLHHKAQTPPDDVMVVLTENGSEDWSFGRGQAQYVLNPPSWTRNAEKGN